MSSLDKEGYVRIYDKGKHWKEHRLVWTQTHGEIPKGMVIDHINNNKQDNRIENLQCITNKQNALRKNHGKGYFKVRDRFKAYKSYNGKHYYLGYFGTACGAYMKFKMFFIGGQYV
tara:strand:+ start:69 stop:416 length:348 start_codon:yes stop_codon:yes gene_type:complete